MSRAVDASPVRNMAKPELLLGCLATVTPHNVWFCLADLLQEHWGDWKDIFRKAVKFGVKIEVGGGLRRWSNGVVHIFWAQHRWVTQNSGKDFTGTSDTFALCIIPAMGSLKYAAPIDQRNDWKLKEGWWGHKVAPAFEAWRNDNSANIERSKRAARLKSRSSKRIRKKQRQHRMQCCRLRDLK